MDSRLQPHCLHETNLDQLSKLLERFPLRAHVFYSGRLCGSYAFERGVKPGHFHFIRSGRVELIDGDERLEVSEPSIIFMPSADTHRLVAAEGAEALCATVRFGPTGSGAVVGALPRLIVIPVADAPLLPAVCRAMFDEVAETQEGRQAALNRLCELAVITLLRSCIDRQLVRGGTLAGLTDARLLKALDAMHAQPNREWSLGDLGGLAGMSRARFASHFRTVVGRTPGEHLLACRLSEAQSLILQGIHLKTVAERVGFGSASALTRAFTRVVGAAPVAWLAAARQDGPMN